MNPALAGHVMSHPGTADLFRTFVGYPLFGSAFRTLWPLCFMPLLASWVADRAARALPLAPKIWLPAAAFAALPGLVALGELWLVMNPTVFGATDNWRVRMLMWFVPAIGGMLLAYVALRACVRQYVIHRLFKTSCEPGPRLAGFAESLGIPARELATDASECFVAGMLRPTVFVSRGVLTRLSDAELMAALHHERAHVRGHDTLLLSLLSLLGDLAPFSGRGALEFFQSAREARADQAAVAGAGRLNLASALLALARPGPVPAAVLPMAKSETLRWRLQALLEEEAQPPGPWWRLALGFAFAVSLLLWPSIQLQLHGIFCWS